jgi:hypothetical protein
VSPTLVAVTAIAMILAGFVVTWRLGGPPARPADPATPVRLLVLGLVVLDGAGAVALAAAGESVGGSLLVAASFPAIALGVLVVDRLAGRPSPLEWPMTVGRSRLALAGLIAVLGLVAYGSIAVAHGIPLLTRDPQDTRLAFGGLVFDAFRWLVPPGAIVAIALAVARPSRSTWLVAAAGTSAVAALEVMAASRALPFELGVAALLIVLWAGRRFSARVWIAVALAAATLFLGVLFARMAPGAGFRDPVDAANFAVDRTIGRVVLIQPRTVEVIVATFPDDEDYLFGSTYVRWLAPLTGAERPPSLGSQLFEELFPGEPPGGFAAPGLLGEGYANFGLVGALGLMVALGALAAALGVMIPRWPADPATRTLAALLTVAILRTYATSLNGFLLTAGAAVGWWLLVAAPIPDWIRRFRARTAA